VAGMVRNQVVGGRVVRVATRGMWMCAGALMLASLGSVVLDGVRWWRPTVYVCWTAHRAGVVERPACARWSAAF
jgi:hypothetical protein